MILDILSGGSSVDFYYLLSGVIASIMVIFLVMPLHEFAHGWMANKLGDPTAKYSGRLTLNPLSHIDPIGALMILFVGVGYAKPVPVNPYNFKKPKLGMALTALAGPLSNLVASLIAAVIYIACIKYGVINLYAQEGAALIPHYFFSYYIQINIGLAVFNLIPVAPLDGSRIFAAILPDKFISKMEQYSRIIIPVLFALLLFTPLSNVLGIVSSWIYNIIISIANLPFQIF